MRIGVNFGHTLNGAGSGAVGIISESLETRNVGNAFIELLIKNGHEVVNCTIDKASTQMEYLKKVAEMANRQDLDYFISFHFNASNGQGHGVEVYTYEGRQFEDALEVCANISALGFTNRGVKNGTGLYVVKKTKAKSMLIEVCFVDNVGDVETYRRVGSVAIAEAAYKAITNVEEAVKPVETPQAQPTPEPTPNKIFYKVKVNTPSGVNCRNKPNGDKIKAYSNGTVLIITQEQDGWGYTGEGWVKLEYTARVLEETQEPPKPSKKPLGVYEVTASALVVRKGPGSNYARKSKKELTKDAQKHSNDNGALLKGTKVTVKEWDNDWARIPSGWVSGKYLKNV